MATERNVLQLVINGKNNAGKALGALTRQLAVLGATASAAFGLSVKAAAEFERGMAEISTLLDGDTTEAIKGMRSELLDLSVEFGQSIDKMVKARYDIVSAGFTDAAESAAILRASTKLAVAAVSDVSTTADLLTTALNANGLSYEYVDAVADVLFQTVRKGKTTMDQLGSSLGNIFATAGVAGVDIREVAAAMAVLTASGVNTNESVTALVGLLNALAAPSSEAAEALAELGVNLDQGLQPALVALADVTEEGLGELSKLIPNIRALKAAAVAAKDVDSFNQALTDMDEATGVVDDGLEDMRETFGFAVDQMKAAITALRIEIGSVFLPKLTELVQRVNGAIETFRENRDAIFEAAQQLANFGIVVGKIAFGLLAFKTVLRVVRAAGLLLNKEFLLMVAAAGAALAAIKLASIVADDVLRALASVPQIDATVYTLFGVELDKLADKAELLEKAMSGDRDAIRSLADSIPFITEILKLFSGAIGDVGDVSSDTQKTLNDLGNSVAVLQADLKKSKQEVKDFATSLKELAQVFVDDVAGVVFSVGDQMADMFTDITTGLIGLTEGPILVGRAFKAMAVSIIADIARIIARVLVARLLLKRLGEDLPAGPSGEPGSFFGNLLTFGARALLPTPFKAPPGSLAGAAPGVDTTLSFKFASLERETARQTAAIERFVQRSESDQLAKTTRRVPVSPVNINVSRPFRTGEQLELRESVANATFRTRRYRA